MFKKVRLQLTLINIAVVGVILLIFLSGIYILMQQNTERQSEQLLHAIASDLRRPQRSKNQGSPVMKSNSSFYIRYDADGNVIDESEVMPIIQSELESLIEAAMKNNHELDIIKLGTVSYRYYRNFSPDLRSVTIVFENIQQERETLIRLSTILIIIGLGGLIIVFISSLFLAGRALIPIKKSWEKQQSFVADASHELRSPLAVMQTSLELVLGNKEETVESQSKWLENIQAENKRMTKLVNDLLFLARADSNQQTIERAVFPMNKVIQEVVDTFGPLATKKSIQLGVEIKDEVEYFGDENRLKQLAVILLDNAIKYTPVGGRTKVTLRQIDNHIELNVMDTGEGITNEHLDKIFDRFYRVDKARSRDSGGTGLGLSIANWIVKEHKGTISVSSVPGKGSTFKVLLPKVLQKD
jgi:two-component system, OmpR family, sensor histidine kinase CiaH